MRRVCRAAWSLCRFAPPFGTSAAALLLSNAPAYAQGATIVQSQPVPYLELLVTGVLAGVVVFVVCRSSHRN